MFILIVLINLSAPIEHLNLREYIIDIFSGLYSITRIKVNLAGVNFLSQTLITAK